MENRIKVFNKDNLLQAQLGINDNLAECWIERRQNEQCSLTFSLPLSSPKWLDIQDPQNTFEVDGIRFSMLKPDDVQIERTEDNKLVAVVSAVETYYLLRKKRVTAYNSTTGYDHITTQMVVLPSGGPLPLTVNGVTIPSVPFAKGTAGYALYALLHGSGWTVGIVDVDGIQDLETDKLSVYDNIQKVKELWGGILVFDSINQTVGLRDESKFQPYTGFQVRYGKNLKHIAKARSSSITTRLYVYGADGLNMAAVNGGKEYLENYSYTNEIYEDNAENPDITDAAKLKEWGLQQIAKVSKPQFVYKTSIVDLRTLPEFEHETVALHDIVDIVDMDVVGTSKEQRRVVYHKYNPLLPYLAEFEIGDEAPTLEVQLKKAIDASAFIGRTFNSMGIL